MHTTDVPLSPDERLHEIAGILAAGLLWLRTRPQLAATSDISGGHVPPQESADSAQKALGLPVTARPDPHAG
ncbi:MAG TPA: hypothetical protein ENN87_08540 [Phycisphaerales bacterium]|nr:hypothetical protein [Phycisphaerales bacterium]